MDLLSTLRIAMLALARNKMRSGLTMLGIIIGVGAVIATVGMGQGANQRIQDQIANMGSNMLTVMSGSVNRSGTRTGWGSTKTLVQGDVEAMLRECPAVAAAAPGAISSVQVVFGNENWSTRIVGTEPQYFEIRNWNIESGASFTARDVETAANVALIGETVRKNLFGPVDPIGQTMRIKSLPFRIVGVLGMKGQSMSMGGNDEDDIIIIPITTLQKKITGETWLRFVWVSAVSKNASYAAEQQIAALLRDRHKIRPGGDDDFIIRNFADMADLADESGRVMTLLLASVASVSLLVGGIGIMNIMLVSVTERTREIGIRMAIGATEEDVQRQFLIEAVVLSLIGGALGILFGVVASRVIATTLGWAVIISGTAVLVAALFSMAVGVFFGFYPARKAARLDPIEALRYE